MLRGLVEARVDVVVVGGVAAVLAGSPRVTNDLDLCYDSEVNNLTRLAGVLASWDAYPRGVESGLRFAVDVKQLQQTPIMTLRSTEGDIDVMDRIEGVGAFAAVSAGAVEYEAFGIHFLALDLPALIASKRAAARPKDLAHL